MAFDEFKVLMDKYIPAGTTAGTIKWPEDEQTRVQLCRAIFGQQSVRRMDRILDNVEEWLSDIPPNPPLRPESLLAKSEERKREALRGLSDQQRESVRMVARYVAATAFFGAMVGLDQFFGCTCRILCQPDSEGGHGPAIQMAPGSMDLHDDFVECVLEFSRHAASLARREILGPNSSSISLQV